MRNSLKYYAVLLFLVGVFFSSCGGSGPNKPEPDPDPIPENRAPSKPVITSPTNNKLCIDNEVAFKWNAATDTNGDKITYQLQVATDNQFTDIAQSISSNETNRNITLEKGKAYYWRVKAIDSKNMSSDFSNVFQFYTEGEGVSNHLPFLPSLIEPEPNKVVQVNNILLKWQANDIDNDELKYDVYLDTVNPPEKLIAENQLENSLTKEIESSTKYYWKIVVKDNKGAVTYGLVWSFVTD